MERIYIELLQGGRLPERKTDGAIGYDLYVPADTKIFKGRNVRAYYKFTTDINLRTDDGTATLQNSPTPNKMQPK